MLHFRGPGAHGGGRRCAPAPTSQLYHLERLISSKEDAANNYTHSYDTTGKEIVNLVPDLAIKLAYSCTGLQGFLICYATSGSTGSVLASLLLEHLSVDCGKTSKLGFAVMPFPQVCEAVQLGAAHALAA